MPTNVLPTSISASRYISMYTALPSPLPSTTRHRKTAIRQTDGVMSLAGPAVLDNIRLHHERSLWWR